MSERKKVNISLKEIALQNEYIEMMRMDNELYFEKNGKRKKAMVVTYGCPEV